MLVTVMLGFILYLFLVKYYGIKINKSDFPMYPGALPIIGNVHQLFGDNVHIFNIFKKISAQLLDNGGYLALMLGPFKHLYFLADPDDCASALGVCFEKHYTYSFANAWLGEGLLTAHTPTWKKNRKLFNPLFSLQQLRRHLPVFNNQARRLVDKFAEHENIGAFNPEFYILLVSLETICQTTLGNDLFEDLTKKKKYVEAINSLMDIIVIRFKKVWLHSDFIFNWSSLRKRQDESLGVINTLSHQAIHKRKSELYSDAINVDEENGSRTFLDTLIKVAEEHERFTDKNVQDEINSMITGGYDTTANGIIYCLMLLGQHQDVQEKLSGELKEIFCDSDRDAEKDDIAKLVYLEAVLKETLRLYPVAPLIGRHTDLDLKLKNHTIPAGSDFFVSIYAINRHPMWGSDAEQFRPDRWLDGTAPTNPNLFASFGLGKRSCIGKTYNMLSMKTTISHVVRRFRISADISKLVLKQDMMLKPASGQHIILEPRILS